MDVGRTFFRRDGEPDHITVANNLTELEKPRVDAHEIAHVIDRTADRISVKGVDDELRAIYDHLNNPQSYGKKFGPKQNRYRDRQVQRELVAEAIRAYMADPKYIKTVALQDGQAHPGGGQQQSKTQGHHPVQRWGNSYLKSSRCRCSNSDLHAAQGELALCLLLNLGARARMSGWVHGACPRDI